jgi:hypothetical protein
MPYGEDWNRLEENLDAGKPVATANGIIVQLTICVWAETVIIHTSFLKTANENSGSYTPPRRS